MLALFLCWLVAPLATLGACVGLSLLVERLAALELPWAFRPALGLAVMIVAAQFGTVSEETAQIVIPAILVLAAVGVAFGFGVPTRRPDRYEIGVPAVVFLLFAAPFVAIGSATWAGYIKLDDTATWLTLTSHIFEHGRGLGGLAPSTFQQVIEDTLGGSYPIGAFVPIAVMGKVSGQDIAFTLQPAMALVAAMLGLLLFELARRFVRGPLVAGGIAVVACLSSILLATYLWGGIKELVTAMLLPLGPLIAGWAARNDWPAHVWAPLGLTVAATIAVLGPGGGVWAVAPLLPALVAVLWQREFVRAALVGVPLAAFSFLLVLPVLLTPTTPFDPLTKGITRSEDYGNLVEPLNPLQMAGIWPALDFRYDPHLLPGTLAVAVVCLLLAAGTLLFAAGQGQGRGIPLVGYLLGGALGGALIARYGSPWIDAKVLATLSPGILAAALIGIAMLHQRAGMRIEAGVLGAVIVGGVLWSAALAYQGIWFAPRDHYEELAEVGDRFAGKGPALVTEVSIFGPRHFLRELDAEGASDRRRRPVYLADGSKPEEGQPVDIDRVRGDQLDPYNLVVTRRSAVASRAPGIFDLVSRGRYYDVWQRGPGRAGLLERMPLGEGFDPAAPPDCAALGELAGRARHLLAAPARDVFLADFTAATLPAGWRPLAGSAVIPSGSGSVTGQVELPGGEYELWLGGAIFGRLTVRVDGREVSVRRARIDNTGGFELLRALWLGPGSHTVELDYRGASLAPGSATKPWALGPVVFSPPQAADEGPRVVDPADYRQLCGRRWDWIEAYDGSAVRPVGNDSAL